MTLSSFLTKVIGGTTLYYSAKDINRFGMAFKNKNPQAKIAESYPDDFISSQRIVLSNTVLPTIIGDAQKSYFDFCLRDRWFPFIHGITGYISGVCTGLLHNIIPIGLGIGALAWSKGRKADKVRNVKGKKMYFEKMVNPTIKHNKDLNIKGKKIHIDKTIKCKHSHFKPIKNYNLRRFGGKICAALLLFGAAKSIMTNVFGLGDLKRL